MEIIINKQSDILEVKLVGELHPTHEADFEQHMQSLLEEEVSQVEIDCSEFTHVNSFGLRVFQKLQHALQDKQASMCFKNLQPEVEEIFSVTGMDTHFTIES